MKCWIKKFYTSLITIQICSKKDEFRAMIHKTPKELHWQSTEHEKLSVGKERVDENRRGRRVASATPTSSSISEKGKRKGRYGMSCNSVPKCETRIVHSDLNLKFKLQYWLSDNNREFPSDYFQIWEPFMQLMRRYFIQPSWKIIMFSPKVSDLWTENTFFLILFSRREWVGKPNQSISPSPTLTLCPSPISLTF